MIKTSKPEAPQAPPPGKSFAIGDPRLRDQLCFALYATSHAISRRYKPLLTPLGLTYPQYICMMVLWETDDLTVSALGAELLLDSGTLTPLLKRLERAQLLRRERDPDDERQVRIKLTQAGTALKASAAAITDAIICATGRSIEEIVGLRDNLTAIRRHLDTTADER